MAILIKWLHDSFLGSDGSWEEASQMHLLAAVIDRRALLLFGTGASKMGGR